MKTASLIFLLLVISWQMSSATNYYVATNGSDTNNGTTLPFKTISKAGSVAVAGDVVNIADGTYTNSIISVSGNANAYIVFKSTNKWGAKIAGSGGSDGLAINGNYIEINGIEVTNPEGHGFNAEGNHHIKFINNHAYNCGNSGITCANQTGDFYYIDGNVCNNNASLSWYSGISIYEPTALANDANWTYGYHIVIRNNICYGNFTTGGLHTDGNGIILDDWNKTQNTGTKYTIGALVENNLCYNNGGAGLKVCWTDNIVMRNNTSYNNNLDPVNDGTYRGDLYLQQARGCKLFNNVSWSIAGSGYLAYNTAMMDKGAAVSGGSTTANIWANNIFYAGNATLSTSTGDGSTPTLIANLAVNPLFVTVGSDFHLQASSPAISAGTTTYGVGTTDLDGNARVNGTIDLGAYEYGGTTGNIAVTGVTLSPTSASLTVGATQQLTATIAPSNATNKNVSYASSNTAVATVSASGLATAVAAGTATITVTTQDGAKTATCAITVTNSGGGTATDITIQAESYCASSGVINYGTLVGDWSLGDYTKYCTVNLGSGYTTLKMRLATVLSGSFTIRKGSTTGTILGTINFTSSGSWETYADYSCTLSGASGTQDVFVVATSAANFDYMVFSGGSTNIAVTAVSLSPSTCSIEKGTIQQLVASVAPSNATNKTVTYSSSNATIATVNASGLITGVAAGNATITVTTQDGNKTATCAVTVTAPSAPDLTIQAESFSAKKIINSWSTGIGSFGTGAYVKYSSVNLSSGYAYFYGNIASTSSGSLDIRINSQTGTIIGTLNFTPTGSWSTYTNQKCSLTGASGIHDVYVTYRSGGTANVDYWIFSNSTTKSAMIEKVIGDDLIENPSVYPNPIAKDGQLIINATQNVLSQLTITDLQGRIVIKESFDTQLMVNLSETKLKTGMYILKIVTNGQLNSSKLLVR